MLLPPAEDVAWSITSGTNGLLLWPGGRVLPSRNWRQKLRNSYTSTPVLRSCFTCSLWRGSQIRRRWSAGKLTSSSSTKPHNKPLIDLYDKNPCVWLLWHWSSRGQLPLCNQLGLTASWVLSSTDEVKISVKEAIQNEFLFLSTLKKQIQPINPLKTVSKVGDLPSTIAMTAHCFGALSQVRAIEHCVIGQERDLLPPDWLNWWMCPWVPALEIQIFLTLLNLGTHRQVWGKRQSC